MTPEQVSALSDNELNRAMIWFYPPKDSVIYNGTVDIYLARYRSLDHLSSFDLTMPLAFKYGITAIKDNHGSFWVGTDIQAGDGFAIYMDNDTENDNPLRAICECLVLIALADK